MKVNYWHNVARWGQCGRAGECRDHNSFGQQKTHESGRVFELQIQRRGI